MNRKPLQENPNVGNQSIHTKKIQQLPQSVPTLTPPQTKGKALIP